MLEKWRYKKLFGLVENKVRINLSNESGHFKKQNKKSSKSVFFKKIIKIKFKEKKRRKRRRTHRFAKPKKEKTKSIITKGKSKEKKKNKKQKAPLQRKSQKRIYKKIKNKNVKKGRVVLSQYFFHFSLQFGVIVF